MPSFFIVTTKKSAKVHLSSGREAVKLANDVKQKTNIQTKENKDWKHQLKIEQRKRCKTLTRNETQRSNMKAGKIRRFSAYFICHPLGIWRATFKLNWKKTRKRQTHVGKLKTLKALSVLTLNVSGHVLSEGKKRFTTITNLMKHTNYIEGKLKSSQNKIS